MTKAANSKGQDTAHYAAAGGPNRAAPPARERPDHVEDTIGLFPRNYRERLATADGRGFAGRSEYGAATVHYHEPTPILGTAIHAHHAIRPDITPKLKLSAAGRYYEEDPETHRFTGRMLHQLMPNQSRYEFDINRPPDTTVYTKPSLAWGQDVWREPLTQYEKEFSLEKWYEYHTFLDCAVEDAINRYGYAILFDFHSYNYQRTGPTDWRTDGKPVINIGTRHLDLDARGEAIKDEFMAMMHQHTVLGEACMVQENGVFYGGYVNRRLSHLYGPRVITLSVEYKKVYMDEATGQMHDDILDDLVKQMDETVVALGDSLGVPTANRSEVPDLGPTGRP